MSRKTAREHVFRIVYEIPFNNNEEIEILKDRYLRDFLDDPADEEDLKFIAAETAGICTNLSVIDENISQTLKTGWKLSRLSKVELAILRLAAYEILFDSTMPISVSINEAVELAKKYAQEKAPAFINGILSAIAPKGIEDDNI